MTTPAISRRTGLKAAGTAIALPALESFGPRRALAVAASPPKRLAFLGIGFGVTQETWFPDPKTSGPEYALTPGLEPLARHKSAMTIVQGASHRHSGDPHAGSTFWLTGANRYAQPGQSFSNTVSVDQVAAEHLGGDSRFQSLRLSGSEPQMDGVGHGPGLSLSWDAGGRPLAAFDTPLITFQRLFGAETDPVEVRQAAITRGESVLDAVMEEARSMQRQVGTADRKKLDEYFESVRDIETRLARQRAWLRVPKPEAPIQPPPSPVEGIEEVRLMYDLIVAAFQTDSSRVVTFRQPIKHLLSSLGIAVGAHDMSHYNPGERTDASQKRDVVQSKLLAELIDKLQAVKEADGSSLLDHTVLCFGSNISTGIVESLVA